MKRLIAAILLVLPAFAHASSVVPTSYSYVVGPQGSGGFSYPDSSGKELTDGYASAGTWSQNNEFDRNVGWFQVDPTIRFFFDQVHTFTGITMNIQDTGGQAGVGIANSFNVNGLTSASIVSTGTANSLPRNIYMDLSPISPTNELLVTVTRGSDWTFISEFTFEVAAVPLPASVSMLLAGLFGLGGLAAMRRFT